MSERWRVADFIKNSAAEQKQALWAFAAPRNKDATNFYKHGLSVVAFVGKISNFRYYYHVKKGLFMVNSEISPKARLISFLSAYYVCPVQFPQEFAR